MRAWSRSRAKCRRASGCVATRQALEATKDVSTSLPETLRDAEARRERIAHAMRQRERQTGVEPLLDLT